LKTSSESALKTVVIIIKALPLIKSMDIYLIQFGINSLKTSSENALKTVVVIIKALSLIKSMDIYLRW